MKLKDIFKDTKTKVFIVTNEDDKDILNWIIEPTNFNFIPEEEGIYITKAFQVSAKTITDCYLEIITPERIAETVIKKNAIGKTVTESIYDQNNSVIPSVASYCFGDYNIYYSKENPQIGINILRAGLDKAMKKSIIAEDLGYILRDEERIEEGIEAFKISEQFEPSSYYIYFELSQLYKKLGLTNKQIEYEQKFRANGGNVDE